MKVNVVQEINALPGKITTRLQSCYVWHSLGYRHTQQLHKEVCLGLEVMYTQANPASSVAFSGQKLHSRDCRRGSWVLQRPQF